ncbi:hypothetical protein GCM10007939_03410 [Amylibacter marinus]|uniref:Phage tail assembly chaperone n=1 Tax=Amylibacter marinus TaxID=1475483 RepID=A0ABQ5VRL6_9RHOB|nr:rcc01693 family protein [Amylibacter marinus]GLQ34058.1 hypothetical protein GCM10007939_03410 [Amylibacter marinus]
MSKLDWPELMGLGLHQLGLSTDEFWRLTPHELLIKLGKTNLQSAGLSRSGLEALIHKYPDTETRSDHG